MLATALRRLVVAESDGGDGRPASRGEAQGGVASNVLLDVPLQGTATALDWDSLYGRVAVAVSGAAIGQGDRVSFLPPQAVGEEEEQALDSPELCCTPVEYALPGRAGVNDLSVCCLPEECSSLVALGCSDGALRLLDASKGAGELTVVRTAYSHGVAATAVRLSHDGRHVASGSASGHVVVQPFNGTAGASPLPVLSREKDRESAITSLRYSTLRTETLAACDSGGNLQVWDARALRHVCRFPRAHTSAVRGISFSAQNSDLLISGGDDAQMVFWDVSSGSQIREVNVEAGLVSLSYHSDGYLLAAGTCDGLALIFDLRMLASKSQPAIPVRRVTTHQQQWQRPGAGDSSLRALGFAPPGIDPAGIRRAASLLPPAAVSPPPLGTSTPTPGGAVSPRGGGARGGAGTAPASTAPFGIPQGKSPEETLRALAAAAAKAPTSSEASGGEAGSGVPTAATLQAMMNRLSTRPDWRGAGDTSTASAAGGSTVPSRQVSRGTESGPATAAPAALSRDAMAVAGSSAPAPGPTTPSQPERSRRAWAADAAAPPSRDAPLRGGLGGSAGLAGGGLGTSSGQLQHTGSASGLGSAGGSASGLGLGGSASTFPGSPPLRQPELAVEPREELAGGRGAPGGDVAEMVAASAAASAGTPATHGQLMSAIAEALRPAIEVIREEVRREVRDSQCALLEQSFRLNSELRQDVEELRAEVQRLRGELRML